MVLLSAVGGNCRYGRRQKWTTKHKSDAGTYRKPKIWQNDSKQQCGKKQWIEQTIEQRLFALQRTHQFPVKVIITQRAGSFYRLIVVDRWSPESTVGVGRNWKRVVELFQVAWSFDGHCLFNQITPFCPVKLSFGNLLRLTIPYTNHLSFILDSFPPVLVNIKIY